MFTLFYKTLFEIKYIFFTIYNIFSSVLQNSSSSSTSVNIDLRDDDQALTLGVNFTKSKVQIRRNMVFDVKQWFSTLGGRRPTKQKKTQFGD